MRNKLFAFIINLKIKVFPFLVNEKSAEAYREVQRKLLKLHHDG